MKRKAAAEKIPNPCFGASLIERLQPVTRYAATLPFKASTKQLTAYANHHRYALIRNWRTKQPTFDDTALTTLCKRYPADQLFPLLAEVRQVQKCDSTYVQGLEIGSDGRLHDTYRHTPKTLRLSAKKVQVFPRADDDPDSKYLNRVKEQFVASPGHCFIERDFSGIEGVLVAYFAADAALLRLTGIDVHGFIASHALGQPADLSWSDSDLIAYFKTLKKENREWAVNGRKLRYDVLRTGCKRVFYLSMYAGGPGEIVRREPKIYPTKASAKWAQDLFFTLFPAVRRWHWAVCEEAEAKGYITAPSGFRQHFSDVFDYTHDGKQWQKQLGLVAKECIAAKPQHTAACITALALIRADADPLLHDGLRLQLHDAIMAEYPTALVEEANMRLKTCMEASCPLLPLPEQWHAGTHLAVKTDGKRSGEGGSWASMA